MTSEKPSANLDALLEPLLLAVSDEQADALLSEILATHIEPVIKGVVRYKLHFHSYQTMGQVEADDLHQEVIVQLLGELQKLRAQPQAHVISDVKGLAAMIAHRACYRWMRRQFPERHALKNRLYYLLTRQSGFALWQNESRVMIVGFAAWQGQKNVADAERIKQLSENEKLIGQIRLLQTSRKQAELSDILAAIFNHLGSPVEFDELVGAVALLLQIRDQPLESIDREENPIEFAAKEKDPAWQVEKRIFLQRLWVEVGQLPPNQRAALLLNLKDAEGRGCIALFPATGVATFRQLAEILELSPETFAELWNELPLDDLRIAELLHLTRQQVINARKSARERLGRRLKGFF